MASCRATMQPGNLTHSLFSETLSRAELKKGDGVGRPAGLVLERAQIPKAGCQGTWRGRGADKDQVLQEKGWTGGKECMRDWVTTMHDEGSRKWREEIWERGGQERRKDRERD